jgi:hypothetical protein
VSAATERERARARARGAAATAREARVSAAAVRRARWLAVCVAIEAWRDGRPDEGARLLDWDAEQYQRLAGAAGRLRPGRLYGTPQTLREAEASILARAEHAALVAHERADAADRLLALVRAAADADAADPSDP